MHDGDRLADRPEHFRRDARPRVVVPQQVRGLVWLVKTFQPQRRGAMGADERVVHRVRRWVLLEAGTLEEQVRQQHADGGVAVGFTSGDNAFVAEFREGQADRVVPAQAVDGDALALFGLHQPAADDVVLHCLEDIVFAGLDDLLGILGIQRGGGPNLRRRGHFLELLGEPRLGNPMEYGPHAGHGRLVIVLAGHEEDPRVLRSPDRVEHPQGEGQPADVLGGAEVRLRRVAPALELTGKAAHVAVDDRRNVALVADDLIGQLPKLQLHGADDQVRRVAIA